MKADLMINENEFEDRRQPFYHQSSGPPVWFQDGPQMAHFGAKIAPRQPVGVPLGLMRCGVVWLREERWGVL